MPNTTRLIHDHELDDKLHEGCPMCEYIISLKPAAAKERAADVNAELHAKRARKSQHE
jgi:hypothetical protein